MFKYLHLVSLNYFIRCDSMFLSSANLSWTVLQLDRMCPTYTVHRGNSRILTSSVHHVTHDQCTTLTSRIRSTESKSHGMESVLDISSGNTQTQHISECSNIGTRRRDEECAYHIPIRLTIRTRAHRETTAASLYASVDPSRMSSTNAFACGHQQEEKHRSERATHTSFIVMKTNETYVKEQHRFASLHLALRR